MAEWSISSGTSSGGGDQRRRCAFCGRRDEVVRHLVRARMNVYICESCVAQAHEAIAAAGEDDRTLRIRSASVRLPDRDEAEDAIIDAFEAAFISSNSLEKRCAAIEDGANLADSLNAVANRHDLARELDVVVDQVRFVSEDEAEVKFVLLLPILGSSGMTRTGHAIRVDGHWKVSRETWCDVARVGGVQCPPRGSN